MYLSARKWMGQIRGGLASATVVACALIAAITGGTTTGILVMSKVALPQMKKYGYDEAMAAGSISSASTMGILIPPSIGFVIYGIICEQPIGKLFMAGVIPGVLQAVFYVATIYIWCRINPKLGPPGPKTGFKEKLVSLRYTWPILALFLLVIGGIYGGVFTPTEAGAVGAFGSIVVAACLRRFTRKRFINAVSQTAIITGMIMLMIVGTFLFMQFMSLSRLPQALGTWIAALSMPGWVILTAMVVLYFVLGGPLPELPLIMVTIPIFYPVIVSLGISPIWFGVIIVRMLEVGSISPPVGQNIFVMNAVSGVPITKIYQGTWPFLFADALHIILLIAVPWLSLALPNLMR
jgi:tripartite ATP-independent transporter DctM subunit